MMETQQAMIIPNWFYGVVGFLIISNIGTIISILVFGMKISFKLGEKFMSIEKDIEANDNKANLAHSRIDKLEGKVWK